MTATSASENDGAFQEIFWLGVTKKGGSEYQFAGVAEDLTALSEGDKDGASVVLGNGGRIWKRTPEGDFEFTAKIYPLSLNVTDSTDMAQFFLGGTYDSSSPVSQTGSHGRDLFQIVLLFSDDTTIGAASSATTIGYASRRTTFKAARVTAYKKSYSDKILSAEVTFKGPAFDRTGASNVTEESTTSQASGLPALSPYT